MFPNGEFFVAWMAFSLPAFKALLAMLRKIHITAPEHLAAPLWEKAFGGRPSLPVYVCSLVHLLLFESRAC